MFLFIFVWFYQHQHSLGHIGTETGKMILANLGHVEATQGFKTTPQTQVIRTRFVASYDLEGLNGGRNSDTSTHKGNLPSKGVR
jgi:hypothetical protein